MRARRPALRGSLGKPHFNPRARVGRDKGGVAVITVQYISIHAPAWGATAQDVRDKLLDIISIHAPAWGATELFANWMLALHISIHAPA